MFKKILKAFLFAAVGIAAMVSQAQAKVIVVGTNPGFVPFEFNQDGKLVGFDVDLWNAIAKHNGWQSRWQSMDFDGIVPALQTSSIDAALSGISITPKREQVIDFSAPYYDSGLGFLVSKANANKYHTLADFKGKKIAVQTGTVAVDWLRKNLPSAKLAIYNDPEIIFLEVQHGNVDAAVHDSPNVAYYAQTAGKGKTEMVLKITTNDHYGIAFPKGSNLVKAVDATLAKMKADGEYQAIYNKWFGSK